MEDWIQGILEYGFSVWNGKLQEILDLLSTSPRYFRDGEIWRTIRQIFQGLQGIGLGLVTLFFIFGLVKTCSSYTEIKKPEMVFKQFIRLVLSKTVVSQGLTVISRIMNFGQGIISEILSLIELDLAQGTTLPEEIITAIEDSGFWANIGNFMIALIGTLVIIVLSFMLVLTVYGRFIKLYLYSALAPIPLSTFAGSSTQSMGISYLKTYFGVCLEGAAIVLACMIFSKLASTTSVDPESSMVVMKYIVEVVFNMLVLLGTVKMSDQIVRNMMGI